MARKKAVDTNDVRRDTLLAEQNGRTRTTRGAKVRGLQIRTQQLGDKIASLLQVCYKSDDVVALMREFINVDTRLAEAIESANELGADEVIYVDNKSGAEFNEPAPKMTALPFRVPFLMGGARNTVAQSVKLWEQFERLGYVDNVDWKDVASADTMTVLTLNMANDARVVRLVREFVGGTPVIASGDARERTMQRVSEAR